MRQSTAKHAKSERFFITPLLKCALQRLSLEATPAERQTVAFELSSAAANRTEFPKKLSLPPSSAQSCRERKSALLNYTATVLDPTRVSGKTPLARLRTKQIYVASYRSFC